MNATTYGLDLAKTVFHAYWVDAQGKSHNRRMKRDQVLGFFGKQSAGLVAMEACGSAHYWAREIKKLGHEVMLIAAQHVRPFVQTNKSDAADAQAIWTAACQPRMRSVPVKTLEQQGVLMLLGERQQLVEERTAHVNRLRGILAECGVILPQGREKGLMQLRARLSEIENAMPTAAFQRLAWTLESLARLSKGVGDIEKQLHALLCENARYVSLRSIPGVGLLTAAMLWAKMGDARQFHSGRAAAAWAGLVPRHSGTGGRIVLGSISKRGDPTLRTMLIHGARSVIAHGKAHSPWLKGMLARRPANVVAVALANKTMRIAWKLLVSNTTFDAAHDPHAKRKQLEAAKAQALAAQEQLPQAA
jgi:transposase